MPLRSLRLASRYAVLGTVWASALIAVSLRAADLTPDPAGESFSAIAERFGLWAALSVVLVAGAIYGLYRQSLFVQRTLVDLIRCNQRCIDRNTDALRDAPCGRQQSVQQDRDQQGGLDP